MSPTDLQSEAADVSALHREAIACMNRRDIAAAQQCCLRIIREDPQHADAHFLLGMISIEVGQPDNALGFIDKAIGQVPDRAEYHAHRARCLSLLKRDAESVEAADRALALAPGDALTLDTIGVVCSKAGDHERAVRAFEQAVEHSPETPGYLFNLGTSLKFLGRFDAAEQALEAAIARNPKFYKAHASLSMLRKQTSDNNHVQRLENLLKSAGDNPAAHLQLHQALAKEYEDLGQYDTAFGHFESGKAARRKTLGYTYERDRSIFAALEKIFVAAETDTAGHPSEAPIFVVGMPRTGTTLIERILTSHSSVHAGR